jgi:site-specific DNA-methyltransferase (adenine-specific)
VPLPLRPYYEDDAVTLYHGDARDILPAIPRASVDLLLTDPPYGMGYGGDTAGGAQKHNVAADGVRQGVRIVRQVLFETAPTLKTDAHLLMFCHWQSWPDFYDAMSGYATMRNALIWHKPTGSTGNILSNYIRDYEVILYAARGARKIGGEGRYSALLTGFSTVPSRRRLHPTEKPTALLAHLARRHCPPGGTVLDPFAGSGSTLLAARAEGVRAVGIEMDEHYCAVAAERLEREALAVA